MSDRAPALLVRNQFELQDVVEAQGRDARLVERDFALMVIAVGLVAEYGNALCFKGGFVLRHVHGHGRFSKDIDATRINPPRNKLDAETFAETIRGAGMRNLLTLNPGVPDTDSARGLDFDQVRYRGPLGNGSVAVEVSYREAVVEEPALVLIGPPYYEPFECPVMQLDEIVAEKLRALVQRVRPTDLADLAMILESSEIDSSRVRRLVAKKFELVSKGNRGDRIATNVDDMAAEYAATVGEVAPDAPTYDAAASRVLNNLSSLLP